jgi:hypothetical protein
MIAGVRVAIQTVAEEDIDGLDDAVLGNDIVALSRDIDWLQSERGRRLARFARRRGHLADGAASIVSWSRASAAGCPAERPRRW